MDLKTEEELITAIRENNIIKIKEFILFTRTHKTKPFPLLKDLLFKAIFYKQKNIAELILGEVTKLNIETQNLNDISGELLQYAVNYYDKEIVKMLLENGTDVQYQKVLLEDISGGKLLRVAVKKKDIDLIEFLLKIGYNVNASDKFGRSALHFVALNEYEGCLGSLIKKANDTNLNSAIAKLLLSSGAEVNATDNSGISTLHVACSKGLTKVTEILLENKADVNLRTVSGITSLHLSIKPSDEYITVIKCLLNNGADLEAKNTHGKTALHLASELGYLPAVDLLLSFDADVDSKDGNGKTPFTLAYRNGHETICSLLFDHGADIDLVRHDNKYLKSSFKTNDIDMDSDSDADIDFSVIQDNELIRIENENQKQDQCWKIINNFFLMNTNDTYLLNKYLTGYQTIYGNEFMDEMKEKFYMEIERMKNEKIEGSYLVYYDILKNNIDFLANFVRNEAFMPNQSSFYSVCKYLKTKYPLCGGIIARNLRKGIKRRNLLERGYDMFYLVFEKLPTLPHYCIEKVFRYLNDPEIYAFINIFDK